MGKLYQSITPAHQKFIENQYIFFVATAPLSEEGRVNLSPKGLNCFRVLSQNKVAYMDLLVAVTKPQHTPWRTDASLLCFVRIKGRQIF